MVILMWSHGRTVCMLGWEGWAPLWWLGCAVVLVRLGAHGKVVLAPTSVVLVALCMVDRRFRRWQLCPLGGIPMSSSRLRLYSLIGWVAPSSAYFSRKDRFLVMSV
ncbi:hypothetical protein GOP47_0011714 [Adiantum capillus-veneris]|uniref:Uncharacterized protein n=1 Tax=Adiantum capillus-veneris TaxID=13818 RepID=A0A9D4UTF4_ADICA|nr:hypothetical protein GOP47_0011714 [Adiantum capillus-veneris]